MFEPMTENEAGLSGGFNGQKTKKKKRHFQTYNSHDPSWSLITFSYNYPKL